MTPDEGNLESGSIDLDKIFEKAKNAGSQIGKLTIRERLAPLIELKELVLERQEELIDIIQKETNKSRSDALFSEIFPIVDTLHWMEVEAENILKDKKVKTPIVLMGKTSYIYHQGLGVVLVISPWNYPLFQALVPIAHALICGNAVIYKPSEFTPLKGAVESLLNDAGVSSDLVQVIYGGGKLGSDLIEKRPDKIFFTGSVGTGKKIMQQAGKHLIPVELELGGKDPMIVFEDANIQRSVKGAAWGAMTNAGQSCTSVERLYVHEDIYENFKSELIVEVGKIKQLIDTNGNSDIGHMTNSQQAKKVRALVLDAVAKGAKALTNEYWIESPKSELEIPAIVLEGVTSEMEIWDCEIFGPILPIFKFSSEIDVINRANDSSFGLSASVWTADKTRATRVTKSLETGNVSVNNVMLTEGNPYLPFGGVKNSGIGRYKGAHGLLSFCNIKSVLFDGNSSKVEANWYPYTTEKYHLFDNLMQALFKGGIMGLIKFAFYGLKLEMLSGKLGKKGRA
ncbi:MAG: aldehyde dehydrogenase family protein [Bacteriovoracaceae bacterium]|nr:aldehyde dehydrogenase family protein [Bacteriovoracaceae bacterium]